ncbi:MAG: hypothetical protein JNM17_18410 [Archangium sp.]|nr:hypothetical protein [Archangium sp.]
MRWFPLVFVFLLASFAACPPPPDPTLGATCATETIGRCDVSAPRLLQCTNGKFTLYADCKGPNGCSVNEETADCDTTGNSVGDHCAPTSEGKVRCDPDGGLNILRCVSGQLDVIFTCMPPSICGISDTGLTCI